MPRWPRSWRPGSCQHLISRFVDRQYRFSDEHDRCAYRERIAAVADLWDWRIISFAFMSSHPHYGLIAGHDAPRRFFGPLHTRYAQYWHKRHGGLGPVFADRPSNFEIQPEHIGRLIAYHHRNPVRAAVVDDPIDSAWTSHRAYLRLEPAPPWLDVELGLTLAGFEDTAAGRRRFDCFVREVNLDDRVRGLNLSDACPPLQEGDRVTGGQPCALSEAEWTRLFRMCSALAHIPADAFGDRGWQASAARRIAVTFAYRELRLPLSQIAEAIGLSISATHHLLRRKRNSGSDLRSAVAQLTVAWSEKPCGVTHQRRPEPRAS